MKTKPPYHDPEGLGQVTAEALERVLTVYQIRQRRDSVLTREVLTFENRQHGANEWLQLNLTVITNPTKFHLSDQCVTGWAPIPVANGVVMAVTNMAMKVIDKLQAAGVHPDLAMDVVEITDRAVMEVLNRINDLDR
jgi:hypothetical protein